MRTITSLAIIAALASVAAARPHRQARKAPATDTAWMRGCIHERTGPDGGVTPTEARRICAAEQPDDDVAAAKRALSLAKANAKVAKARAKAKAAIEACEQAVVDRCVELAEGAPGGRDCTDEALRDEFDLACFAREGK